MTRYWELKHEDGQDDADLYIFGDIMPDDAYKGKNDRSAMDVVTAIENLTAKNLTVHINSYGGDVKEGLAIYNCIKNSRTIGKLPINSKYYQLKLSSYHGRERSQRAPFSVDVACEYYVIALRHIIR